MKTFLQQEGNTEKSQLLFEKCKRYEEYLIENLTKEENLNYFRNKSNDIIKIDVSKWQGNIGIHCKPNKGIILPTFVIDIMGTFFPYHARIIQIYSKGKNNPIGWIPNFLHRQEKRLSKKFKYQDHNKCFWATEPIPINKITHKDELPTKLIKAFIAEYE